MLQMLDDFFTKPLQGNLFRKFRDIVLGYTHIDSLALITPSTVEERVEDRADDETIRASNVDSERTISTNETTNEYKTTNCVDQEMTIEGEEQPWIQVIGKRKTSFQRPSDDNQTLKSLIIWKQSRY